MIRNTCWSGREINRQISLLPAKVYLASSPANPTGTWVLPSVAGCGYGCQVFQWVQNSLISSLEILTFWLSWGSAPDTQNQACGLWQYVCCYKICSFAHSSFYICCYETEYELLRPSGNQVAQQLMGQYHGDAHCLLRLLVIRQQVFDWDLHKVHGLNWRNEK